MKDETKKENPVLLLLKMGGKGQRISNCVCYLCFFRWVIGDWPYIGIYRLMDAFLTDTCSIQVISENAGSNYGDGHYPASISRIIRHFFS